MKFNDIEHYTNYWCKSKGISSQALTSHKQIDDIMLLLKWRDSIWPVLDQKEQGVWAAYWSWCYHKQYPLKNKHLTKLEKITISAIDRHEQKESKLEKQRNQIKQLRKATA